MVNAYGSIVRDHEAAGNGTISRRKCGVNLKSCSRQSLAVFNSPYLTMFAPL